MQFSETNKRLVKIPSGASSWRHWAYLIALKLVPSFVGEFTKILDWQISSKRSIFLVPFHLYLLEENSYYHSMQFIGGLLLFKGCNKRVGQQHGCGHLLYRNLVFLFCWPLQAQLGAAAMAMRWNRPSWFALFRASKIRKRRRPGLEPTCGPGPGAPTRGPEQTGGSTRTFIFTNGSIVPKCPPRQEWSFWDSVE